MDHTPPNLHFASVAPQNRVEYDVSETVVLAGSRKATVGGVGEADCKQRRFAAAYAFAHQEIIGCFEACSHA